MLRRVRLRRRHEHGKIVSREALGLHGSQMLSVQLNAAGTCALSSEIRATSSAARSRAASSASGSETAAPWTAGTGLGRLFTGASGGSAVSRLVAADASSGAGLRYRSR